MKKLCPYYIKDRNLLLDIAREMEKQTLTHAIINTDLAREILTNNACINGRYFNIVFIGPEFYEVSLVPNDATSINYFKD